jgi:tetratricopeptide (TPR) repeat protein
MRPRLRVRAALTIVAVALSGLLVPACGSHDNSASTPGPAAKSPAPSQVSEPQATALRDEIPPDQLDAVVRAHLLGLGAMEQYEYGTAVEAFRQAHQRAPGWIPGSINLAIALLNDSGTKAENAKKSGDEAGGLSNFDEALALLHDVIGRQPDNLEARYCRGLILEFLGQGRTSDAHKDFLFVVDKDPTDGHAWFKAGATLTDPADPSQPAGPSQAQELIRFYSKALECNPYLITAYYKLQQAYGWAHQGDKQRELLARWRQLNPKTNPVGPGDTAEAFYGESGRRAKVVDPFGFAPVRPPAEPGPPPKFDPPVAIKVALGQGERWVKADDFTGPYVVIGRARALYGATVATFDADGDGRADLFLAAALKGPKGIRDALLLNKGDGTFEDVSKAWGLPDDRASLGAAAGDFDADRHIDLFLTGLDGNHLLRNEGGKKFVDVTAKAGIKDDHVLSLTARWLDLDQDGDLDLYVVNCYQDRSITAFSPHQRKNIPVFNAVYRNDGKAAPVQGRPEDNWAPLASSPSDMPAKEGLSLAFTPWPDAPDLIGPRGWYTGIVAADFDDDRDLDLIIAGYVSGSRDYAPRLVLNDRLGKFHTGTMAGFPARLPAVSLLVTDLDKDGRPDLVGLNGDGTVFALRNATDTTKLPRVVTWEPWPIDARGWRQAQASDLDLDTWPDVVAVPVKGSPSLLDWARNDGRKLVNQPLPVPPGPPDAGPVTGFTLADVTGDPLPDLVLLADGAAPRVARNLGNGRHWLALDLGGRWKTSFDHMRTNPHGLGTRITLEGQGLLVTHEQTTPAASLGQSVGPVVLGLGSSPSVELLRLRWPDGTMQCELNAKADTRLALIEFNRKKGSCPVLFTWNGQRLVCLGDFLGGGGLGYLVAPGVYGQPDRDESIAITAEQLQAVAGTFRLAITEPMDEVAYLDRLRLRVVDRPPGVSVTPDERFAPDGPRPTGQVVAWTRSVEPLRATDLKGRDVTRTLQAWDRDTVDSFKRLDGWTGYAEEHGIVLDFGDRLSRFGRDERLLLVLAGWVEYPYSQTNYAAATAGVALRPPAIEKRNDDGTWTVIEPHAGYPAGLPRMTTVDLTGKLAGPRCVIRLRTNMECYWDQAFVAVRDGQAEARLRQSTLAPSRAVLGHRGYTREVSPDGKQPLLYDYDYVDPSPLALMTGNLTRHGDVAPLLRDDDDRLCVVGPGDEVRLEFDATHLGALPAGWTRSYVLEAVGYCKDADPHTATSDSVEPLPWRTMPAFPFPPGVRRPDDPAYRDYLRTYQTRPAGSR